MGDGKAINVIEYLQNLETKGKASSGAIAPLKIAFTMVMKTVEGADNWQTIDVRSIDIEDYMARFANLTMGKYASESLTTYKSRVTRALSWYLQFLEKPGWTPDVTRRAPSVKKSVKTAKKPAVAPKEQAASPSSSAHATQSPNDPLPQMGGFERVAGRILYPYPLLDGQLIHVSLPMRLSKTDAKRIGAFIESIAFDEESKNE